MSQLNPYKSTGVAESESPETASRRLSVLWWLVYFYPVIVLALVYASWIVACVSLGRPPGFGEHPEIQPAHAAFHVLANSTAILLLCCFLFVPSGMVWSFIQPFSFRQEQPGENLSARLVCTGLYILMLVIATFIWNWDPYRVVYWFLD